MMEILSNPLPSLHGKLTSMLVQWRLYRLTWNSVAREFNLSNLKDLIKHNILYQSRQRSSYRNSPPIFTGMKYVTKCEASMGNNLTRFYARIGYHSVTINQLYCQGIASVEKQKMEQVESGGMECQMHLTQVYIGSDRVMRPPPSHHRSISPSPFTPDSEIWVSRFSACNEQVILEGGLNLCFGTDESTSTALYYSK